ncbi:hypothetical protein WA026_022134 [Henosepilachna vigintioctopunctata]|uniref:Uncharacterized protein n=1 Tax=Henosepilachna vigintioctopunctata TaxID=420089 RepID=A0AAW1TPA3_9CUCU
MAVIGCNPCTASATLTQPLTAAPCAFKVFARAAKYGIIASGCRTFAKRWNQSAEPVWATSVRTKQSIRRSEMNHDYTFDIYVAEGQSILSFQRLCCLPDECNNIRVVAVLVSI